MEDVHSAVCIVAKGEPGMADDKRHIDLPPELQVDELTAYIYRHYPHLLTGESQPMLHVRLFRSCFRPRFGPSIGRRLEELQEGRDGTSQHSSQQPCR
jgi:hypothetical protein